MTDIWTYREQQAAQSQLAGFDVEATDGSIGKIDEATSETGAQCLVVDTGFWIFGKKRMIPAGVIETIDLDKEKVYVNMTKDQIKGAPDYDEALRQDTSYRDQVGAYYDPYRR
jgi:hypothetical protein